uniref:DUF4371 domain-containing protein n=1 Tax=Trichuris muris TaxID=70415 RepID=A0A5S6QPJ2_TRIMR
MSESKRKCRQYSSDYLKYGFVPSRSNRQLPMCLICEKVLSNEAMKPSRLLDHLTRLHPDKAHRDLLYFQSLREKLNKQLKLKNMCPSTSEVEDSDGLRASYNISLLIAKTGKAHIIGEELLLPVISEVVKTVLHKPAADIVKKIHLSNDTVQRRIDEMGKNVEDVLCNILRRTQFSLQLDESILPGNEALLLAYARFIHNDNLVQDLLFARELETDTKGESMFFVLKILLAEKEIPLTNIISVATDGAPSMLGNQRGFLAYLKQAVPNVMTVHCVIHRQHLVAKHLSSRLHCSLQHAVAAINKIKINSLNVRLFRKLCDENDEEYNRLLFHSEVRWLSKGNALNRLYAVFETVLKLFEEHDVLLYENLKKFQGDIAYLADLYFKFNEVNLLLQGDNLNSVKTKGVISAFITRLQMFEGNLAQGVFHQFPNLCEMKGSGKIRDQDVDVYCDHLNMLCQELRVRFEDILCMEIPSWVIDPFSCAENAAVDIQEELIELQTNEELKLTFKNGCQAFWLQPQIPNLYPRLWTVVKKLLIAFPSSYLVERGFSVVTDLLSKKRSRLQIAKRGDLRLRLTSFQPNIQKLISFRQ